MKWYIRRTLYTLLSWFLAITVTYAVIRASPGDPATILFSEFRAAGYSIEDARKLVQMYIGILPDEPPWLSAIKLFANLFRGDLGVSIVWRLPVTRLIGIMLPWSLFFAAWSLMWTVIIGVILGLIMAYYRHNKILHSSLRTIFAVLTAAPVWLLAVILHLYLAIGFKIFPIGQPYPQGVTPGLSLEFIGGVLWHYTLPTIVQVMVSFPGWSLGMMAAAVSVLHDDYVDYAKARGIPGRRILISYVARNSILPVYTRIAPTLAGMLVGLVWIESRFVLPGVGSLLATAIGRRDYPLMMGCYFIVITAVVFGNLLTDLTYGLIDPRARYGEV
ncbi:MAG: ABC transporter permease [Desulfurococcaceae archaeon]